ncbi:hypothetical protein Btru_002328 [Bulinus truncatus]|nr:hypothetical protein Btru_002328 [Bulinus truncatus]
MNVTETSITADTQVLGEGQGLMTFELFSDFVLVNLVILSTIIGLPGIVFNLINIIVFSRLGFREPTNVSLTGLAVSDIGVLLTMIGYSVIYNPLLLGATPYTDIIDAINYVALGWPHVLFSRIAGCLTALIAVERFLCVASPLKVKAVITPRRTLIASLAVYTVLTVSSAPAFVANNIGFRYNPVLNFSLVGLVASKNSDFLENITHSVNIFAELASFTLVAVFTAALIRAFNQSSRWRQSASSASKTNPMTSRDKALVKTVILISAAFIACSLPGVLGTCAMMFDKDFSVRGSEKFLFVASFSVFFILGSKGSCALPTGQRAACTPYRSKGSCTHPTGQRAAVHFLQVKGQLCTPYRSKGSCAHSTGQRAAVHTLQVKGQLRTPLMAQF